jgi:hypothetical protein
MSDSTAIQIPHAERTHHASRKHSLLSASGAERWINCHGSVLFSMQMPEEDSSEAAREGTAAHEMSQDCLEHKRDAIEWIDRVIDGFLVDDEWAEAVQEYLDVCRQFMGSGWQWWVERKVSLEPLGLPTMEVQDPETGSWSRQPVDMFGTADFIAFHAETGMLVIVDLKFGKGIVVEVENNAQERYYAVGVLLSLPPGTVVKNVYMVIVQPRIPYGTHVKTADIDVLELSEWATGLMAHAQAALDPNAPLRAGEWCRFCRCRVVCPALAETALSIAQEEFGEIIEGDALFSAPVAPPAVQGLSVARRAFILNHAGTLRAFLTAVEEDSTNQVRLGRMNVPGWRLGATRSRTTWAVADESALAVKLVNVLGLSEEKIWRKKLLTPTQARDELKRLLRADKVKPKEAEDIARGLIAKYAVTGSTGYRLVPEADSREDGAMAGSEFDLLEAPA